MLFQSKKIQIDLIRLPISAESVHSLAFLPFPELSLNFLSLFEIIQTIFICITKHTFIILCISNYTNKNLKKFSVLEAKCG